MVLREQSLASFCCAQFGLLNQKNQAPALCSVQIRTLPTKTE